MREYKANLDKLLMRCVSHHFQSRVLIIAFFTCLRIFSAIATYIVVTRLPKWACRQIYIDRNNPYFNDTWTTEMDTITAIHHNDSACQLAYAHNRRSVLAEWNDCTTATKVRCYEAFIFFSIGAGSVIFAWVANKNGRHMAMIVACFLDILFTILAVSSRYYEFWVAMKLASYMTIGGQLVLLYTYVNEFLPRYNKSFYMGILVIFSVLSYSYVGMLSHLLPSWRFIEIIALVPCAINVVLVTLYFFSSPLWCYHENDDKSAKQIVEKIMEINNYPPTESNKIIIDKIFLNCHKYNGKWIVLEIFENRKLLQRCIALSFVWFSFFFFYFHLTLDADRFVTGDLHLTLLLMTVIDCLANLVNLLVNKFMLRRKILMMFSVVCIICILVAVVVGAVNYDEKGVNMAYYLLARLFALCGFLQVIHFIEMIYPEHLGGIGPLICWVFTLSLTTILMLICAPIRSTAEVSFHTVALTIGFVVTFFLPRIMGQSGEMLTKNSEINILRDNNNDNDTRGATLETALSDQSYRDILLNDIHHINSSKSSQKANQLEEAPIIKAPIATKEDDIV